MNKKLKTKFRKLTYFVQSFYHLSCQQQRTGKEGNIQLQNIKTLHQNIFSSIWAEPKNILMVSPGVDQIIESLYNDQSIKSI
jgi:hypothetical protein